MKFCCKIHRSVVWLLHGVAIVLALATQAQAQLVPGGGALYLYSDADLTDSTYQDQSIGAFSVYVVHRGVTFDAAQGVRFAVQTSPGVTFAWLGENSPMPTVVGDSRTGISIGYGACLIPDPGLILEIRFLGIGTSEACSFLNVVPHPQASSGEIEVILCVGLEAVSATGEKLLVNCPVPVEQTTWGKVKSLYR